MAMPVYVGRKTEREKFAGALHTYCIEAMMQDKKALQAGTSHNLGQNFAKAFDITYLSKDQKQEVAWTTSWGVSTRLIGGLIMTHSDDKGLVLPPKLAPTKVVIVPIFRKEGEKATVLEEANKIAAALRAEAVSVEVDAREEHSPGAKFFYWEQLGVPVTIEIGPRDVAAGTAVVKRRDLGTKQPQKRDALVLCVRDVLNQMQSDLLEAGRKRMKENTVVANSIEDVAQVLSDATAEKGGGKFVMAHIKDDPACDARIKEFKASVRCIPLVDEYDGAGKCIVTGETVSHRSVIAKAY
jgi:prolyl-tRNA synthetase